MATGDRSHVADGVCPARDWSLIPFMLPSPVPGYSLPLLEEVQIRSKSMRKNVDHPGRHLFSSSLGNGPREMNDRLKVIDGPATRSWLVTALAARKDRLRDSAPRYASLRFMALPHQIRFAAINVTRDKLEAPVSYEENLILHHRLEQCPMPTGIRVTRHPQLVSLPASSERVPYHLTMETIEFPERKGLERFSKDSFPA
ncbi:hypothetical protein RRG08_016480 [Elysia crispata]|uniref:Uncharacterized protein n=1 Tax=Elysia crispata TaxID=231223 RepID=A0AAE0Y9C2_9GAST|nr:hypothetical protein RRG08_016480 [Elysia crispata]